MSLRLINLSHVSCRDALEDEEDLENTLKTAFLAADRALQTHLSYFNNGEDLFVYRRASLLTARTDQASTPPSSASFLTAGTTATVAMLRDGVELVVGSVGDSRAMLCRKGRATKLSRDHTPDREDERNRYAVILHRVTMTTHHEVCWVFFFFYFTCCGHREELQGAFMYSL